MNIRERVFEFCEAGVEAKYAAESFATCLKLLSDSGSDVPSGRAIATPTNVESHSNGAAITDCDAVSRLAFVLFHLHGFRSTRISLSAASRRNTRVLRCLLGLADPHLTIGPAT
jgi:hypothetical protein